MLTSISALDFFSFSFSIGRILFSFHCKVLQFRFSPLHSLLPTQINEVLTHIFPMSFAPKCSTRSGERQASETEERNKRKSNFMRMGIKMKASERCAKLSLAMTCDDLAGVKYARRLGLFKFHSHAIADFSCVRPQHEAKLKANALKHSHIYKRHFMNIQSLSHGTKGKKSSTSFFLLPSIIQILLELLKNR